MFSLKQKNNNKGNQQQSKEKHNQNTNKPKPQSKKISKTVFEDPFYYRIELLPQQDSYQVQALLKQYLTKLRQSVPFKPPREGIKRVIRFEKDKNIKEKMSPLISPQIVLGIKKTKAILYKFHKEKSQMNSLKVPHLILVFYDQKKHQTLLQLLSLVKLLNTPYLLLKDLPEINRLLGVRTVGSVVLHNEDFANSLLKYLGKSLIDVPWLIEMNQVVSMSNEMEKQ